MSEIKLIYDLVKEVRETQKENNKELKKQSLLLKDIQRDVEQNTKDLTEHKLGVEQNRKRIEWIETPFYKKYFTKQNISWIIGLIAGCLGIIFGLSRLGINLF